MSLACMSPSASGVAEPPSTEDLSKAAAASIGLAHHPLRVGMLQPATPCSPLCGDHSPCSARPVHALWVLLVRLLSCYALHPPCSGLAARCLLAQQTPGV
jgi:hypothetical protein